MLLHGLSLAVYFSLPFYRGVTTKDSNSLGGNEKRRRMRVTGDGRGEAVFVVVVVVHNGSRTQRVVNVKLELMVGPVGSVTFLLRLSSPI